MQILPKPSNELQNLLVEEQPLLVQAQVLELLAQAQERRLLAQAEELRWLALAQVRQLLAQAEVLGKGGMVLS
jgi:hypothetical protein